MVKNRAPSSALLQIASVAVVGTAAFLIVGIQPLTAKRLLPSFGGNPYVRHLAAAAFQALLLVGYAIAAQVSSGRLSFRTYAASAFAVAVATVAAHGLWVPTPGTSEMAGFLSIGVAAPAVVVLSTVSIVGQAVLASRGVSNPVWLYGASNAGSLLAAVSYSILYVGIGCGIRNLKVPGVDSRASDSAAITATRSFGVRIEAS